MKTTQTLRLGLPLVICFAIIASLWRGLSLHPSEVPSPLINKNIPTIDLPTLFDKKHHLTNRDFLGHITLFNVWASWCYSCEEEHVLLVNLAKNKNLIIYGLDYKDNNNDAMLWLNQNGNPYKIIATDTDGKSAIDWGVYGTPETFIIDKKGIVRYKQIGALTQKEWDEQIYPLIQQLQNESS